MSEDLPQSSPADDGGKPKTEYTQKTVNVVEYDMESFLQSCCDTYDKLVETTGGKVKWEPASTPLIDETREPDKGRDPSAGDQGLKCPW